MSLECLNSGECQQYCKVLDNLTGSEPCNPCKWPERVLNVFDEEDDSKLGESLDSTLGLMVADSLFSVLTKGEKKNDLLKKEGEEISIAYFTLSEVLKAQFDLWRQYAEAAKQERTITDVEVEYFRDNIVSAFETYAEETKKAGVSAESITFAQAVLDRETIEDYGLLFDSAMTKTATDLCVNVATGKSTLLIGDKGIAKTQVAKFVAELFARGEGAKFISGDGSMMKDEFIGKMNLEQENGATITTFRKGILTECMEKGIPLVMDEINLIDPAIVMRLQDILLRKPGDVVTIQEDSGETITIKQGFCVIATANEASSRYQSRAAFDPAFRDRFRIVNIEYPDGDTEIIKTGEQPVSLTRLAYAITMSRNGIASERVTPEEAMWLAKVAHASQQLYSKPAKDISGNLGTNIASVVDDAEPRMADCITPRKMVDILQSIDEGLNPYDTEAGLYGKTLEVIAAMQHAEDRETMFEVIRLLHDSEDKFQEEEIRKILKV